MPLSPAVFDDTLKAPGARPLCRFFKRFFILFDGQRLPPRGRNKSKGGHRSLRKQEESWMRKMMCRDRGQGTRIINEHGNSLSHTMASTDRQGRELQREDEWARVISGEFSVKDCLFQYHMKTLFCCFVVGSFFFGGGEIRSHSTAPLNSQVALL